MSKLELQVEQAQSYAEFHALKCSEMLVADGLPKALEYCREQGIEPPQCSLTAQSVSAENLRTKAARMLSEAKWWKRRLGSQAGQQFEHQQILEGKVTNFISDESLEFHNRKRRKRI